MRRFGTSLPRRLSIDRVSRSVTPPLLRTPPAASAILLWLRFRIGGVSVFLLFLRKLVFFSIWSGPSCDFFVSRLQAFGLLSLGSASTPSPSPSSFPAFLLGALATIGTFQRVADKLVACRTVRPSPRRISLTRVSRRESRDVDGLQFVRVHTPEGMMKGALGISLLRQGHVGSAMPGDRHRSRHWCRRTTCRQDFGYAHSSEDVLMCQRSHDKTLAHDESTGSFREYQCWLIFVVFFAVGCWHCVCSPTETGLACVTRLVGNHGCPLCAIFAVQQSTRTHPLPLCARSLVLLFLTLLPPKLDCTLVWPWWNGLRAAFLGAWCLHINTWKAAAK